MYGSFHEELGPTHPKGALHAPPGYPCPPHSLSEPISSHPLAGTPTRPPAAAPKSSSCTPTPPTPNRQRKQGTPIPPGTTPSAADDQVRGRQRMLSHYDSHANTAPPPAASTLPGPLRGQPEWADFSPSRTQTGKRQSSANHRPPGRTPSPGLRSRSTDGNRSPEGTLPTPSPARRSWSTKGNGLRAGKPAKAVGTQANPSTTSGEAAEKGVQP